LERLTTSEVARILGLRPARIRELVRAGLCQPERSGRSYVFAFQDVVVLRAAHELLRQNVPAARVQRSLAALVAQLPESQPVSGLRIFADGRQVAVRDGESAWQPETGQTLLDFDMGALADRVKAIHESPRALRERRQRAHEAFETGLELEPVDPIAAASCYADALELDPEHVDAWVNLGRLRHEAGEPAEALRLYTAALERDPEDPLIHFNIAVALEDVQGAAPALAHYERAVELDPTFADAHYNLAGLYEQLGRGADALRHYHVYKKLTRS
jgi:tetratricopeptide (TPR) repeat protein